MLTWLRQAFCKHAFQTERSKHKRPVLPSVPTGHWVTTEGPPAYEELEHVTKFCPKCAKTVGLPSERCHSSR